MHGARLLSSRRNLCYEQIIESVVGTENFHHCNVNYLKTMQKLKNFCLALVTLKSMFLLTAIKCKSFEEFYGKFA